MAFSTLCLKVSAYVLIFWITLLWTLNMHVFIVFLCVLGDNALGNGLMNIGLLITPTTVVVLINFIGNFYDEIQSWEIAYIIWGAFVAIIGYAEELWIYRSNLEREEAMKQFYKMALYPFGMNPKEAGEMAGFSYVLISLAPAIVGGYIANFLLEIRYSLQCDEAIYDSISDMCEGGICCVTVSNHEGWIDFIPGLASSMLAAWGIVKALGTFIAKYGGLVTLEEYVNPAELKEEVLLLKEQVKLLAMKMDVSKSNVADGADVNLLDIDKQ